MNQEIFTPDLITEGNNYLIDDISKISNYQFDYPNSSTDYRLYRFLTELEDTIINCQNEREILEIMIPKVRKLLTESDWIQWEYISPDPEVGWSVNILYDEPDFPLTIQMVAWLPEQVSPIHNHGTWGIVAIISGEEKNTFWQRDSQQKSEYALKFVQNKTLVAGDIIGFTRDTIHQVEVVSDEPVISFNVYGMTDFDSRFEFDLNSQTAKKF